MRRKTAGRYSILCKETPEKWRRIGELCMAHCTGNEISAALGISYEALAKGAERTFDGSVCVKHVSSDCEECGEEGKIPFKTFTEYKLYMRDGGKMIVKATQFELAVRKKNPDMLKWWGKQYLNQTEKQVNHNLNTDFDPSGMTDEELERLRAGYAKIDIPNDSPKN